MLQQACRIEGCQVGTPGTPTNDTISKKFPVLRSSTFYEFPIDETSMQWFLFLNSTLTPFFSSLRWFQAKPGRHESEIVDFFKYSRLNYKLANFKMATC